MEKSKQIVRTELDRDGIIIFKLMRGAKKMRTRATFGYGTCHKIWYRMHGVGTGRVSVTVEPAASVKRQIADWVGR